MRKFLKPTFGEVFIPSLSRNINQEGEMVNVTAYIEKRIASGALKVVEAVVKSAIKKKLSTEDQK